jgi:hypothetical protein
MIAQAAVNPACSFECPPGEFHLFDDSSAWSAAFSPRTVEILTTLRDVFDALGPADGVHAVEAC